MQPGVGIARMQHFAGARIDNNSGIGGRNSWRRGKEYHPERKENANDPQTRPGASPLSANQVIAPDLHDICLFCLLPPVFRLTILPAIEKA